MTVVEVAEWSSATVALTAEAERGLRRAAAGRLTLTSVEGGEVRVTADRRHVGVISAPDVTVIIRPKVPIPTVLHLLESDGRPLRLDGPEANLVETQDLVPAFSTLYLNRLEHLVRAGLRRGYRTVSEQLPAVRGRIDVATQARHIGAYPLHCEYDDYNLDTPLNRRALAATERLLRLPGVTRRTRQGLRRMTTEFSGVGTLRPGDLSTPVIGRSDAAYVGVDRLAALILASSSVSLKAGQISTPSFTLNLERAVQSFVTEGLRRRLVDRLTVHAEKPIYLDDESNVRIAPDLLFTGRTDTRLLYVADVKYKRTEFQRGRPGYARESDYYQLLAYAATSGLPEGMLIHVDDQPLRAISARKVGVQLWSYSLSLDGRVADVERRMDELAATIAIRASLGGTGPDRVVT